MMKFTNHAEARLTRAMVLLLAVILCLSAVAYASREKRPSSDLALMEAAVSVTKQAFDILYAEKEARGIAVDESDLTHSGVIGCRDLTAITTTDGSLSAKRVSTNPNFAALFVKYLRDAGVGEGDEVGLMFSSSFPALNIACLAACEAVGAKVCLMNSIGASVYGATDVDFTFSDMLDILCAQDILHTRISCLSFGGERDLGLDFSDEDGYWVSGDRSADEIRQAFLNKAEENGITFLCESDYATNIASRIAVFKREVPDMKIFISVGGSICSLGQGLNAYIETGYRTPSTFAVNRLSAWDTCPASFGLLQYFHAVGLPVVSLLNIEQLACDMHMDAEELTEYPSGVGDMYTEARVGLWYPLSVLATVLLGSCRLIPLACLCRAERRRKGKLYSQL